MIEVTFKGPTDFKGARWQARGFCGRVTISQDYALDGSKNALAAARAYAAKHLDGCRVVTMGESIHGGYVFVTEAAIGRAHNDLLEQIHGTEGGAQ